MIAHLYTSLRNRKFKFHCFDISKLKYQKRIQDDPNYYLIVVTSKSQDQTRMKVIPKVR